MLRRIASAATVLALAAPAAGAAERSLPRVDSGTRPGPDVLYAPAAKAPQLENAGPWKAEPILVSGAAAYRDGEFLYQDFLHDDAGAAGAEDPGNPVGPGDFLFSPRAGAFTYPTDPVYANNAADLVELRVRPLAGATALRITLNTLKDAERTAVTVALGEGGPHPWPHGAGVSSPAQLFLTVHGSTAELREAATGTVLAPAPSAAVDLRRRQIDVRIPHAAWNPGTGKVRMAAGTGLWDPAAGSYLAPQPGQASATAPGGGLPTGVAIFNVAFRFDEPLPDVDRFPLVPYTLADAAAGAKVDGSWWREKAQSEALALGDVSRFFAEVDFGRLAARVDDDSRVPKEGPLNRILASRYEFGQGVDHSKVCFDLAGGARQFRPCEGRFVGQLQPYALYVPRKPKPGGGYGLTLLLHSLSANHNQYSGSKNQSQLGERGPGSLVITPAGRGPDGFYTDVAEADTFEVWADVARHYDLDPEWVAVSGYSMGGIGTYRLASRWPDLFARGFPVVGSAREPELLPNLRHVPLLSWVAAGDELVNVSDTEATRGAIADLGYRQTHDLFESSDHLTLAINDEYGPGAEFLGTHRVDRSPARVTYVVAPGEDYSGGGVSADHAYWLSGLKLRDAKAAPHGSIDARSGGFGTGDPPAGPEQPSQGVLTGGNKGALPYLRRSIEWGHAPAVARSDTLVVRATNLAAAVVDARRARLSCSPALDVQSDGPLDLKIACAPARLRAADCGRTVRVPLPRLRGRRITSVTVTRGKRVVRRARGRDLRRVTVRRPPRGAFSLRIRARATARGKRTQTVTVLRRYRACP